MANKIKSLPPSGKYKGMYVYCIKCRKHFSWTRKKAENKHGNMANIEPKCGETESLLSNCKFLSKHRYKARVNLPISGKKSKLLNAEDYKTAVIEAKDFELEILRNVVNTVPIEQTNTIAVNQQYARNEFQSKIDSSISINKETQKVVYSYLLDFETEYLDFLTNVDVPEHQQKERSNRHIKEVQKCLKLFNESLSFKDLDVENILLQQIGDTHVGYFHSYLLKEKNYKNRTYNNKMSTLRSFFRWIIQDKRLDVYNPFEKAKNRSVFVKIETITKQEFKDLLGILSPEKGWINVGVKNKKRRSLYRPYIKDGFELALHTGGRREEVVELKWDMIHEIDGRPTYITMRNFKVERSLGEGYNENVTPKIIPITKSLLLLLYRMGYEKNKGLPIYILAPDRAGISTYAIMDTLSKAFSHYYKQLNTGRELHFKCLRKTYLTYLNSVLGKDTKTLSSHASDEILANHYIDEKIINKAVKEVTIFG